MDSPSQFAWPVARLADAVEALARASRVTVKASTTHPPTTLGDSVTPSAMDHHVENLGRYLQVETDVFDVPYDDVEGALRRAAPALVRLSQDGQETILAMVGSSARNVRLLTPEGRHRTVRLADVAAWLRTPLESTLDPDVQRLMSDAGIAARNQRAARRVLLRTRLGSWPACRCWTLRPAPAAPLWQHLHHARLPRRLYVFIPAYVASALALTGAWWLIGRAALQGRFDSGTMLAWVFLLLTLVPLNIFATWSQGVFALGVGGFLKLRLLAGALRLQTDETRHQGVGQHLARVIESEAVEAVALSGGFYAIAASFELVLAAAIFTVAANWVHLILLLSTIGLLVGLGISFFKRREKWTDSRLTLTHDLVEQMVGHRTRLAQEPSARRHEREDQALEHYLRLSRGTDRAILVLSAIPRLWLLLGVAALAPQFVTVRTGAATELAIGLGGILLTYGALAKMTASLANLAAAAIGWKQVGSMVRALQRPEELGCVDRTTASAQPRPAFAAASPLMVAQDLTFRFRDRAEPVLRGCGFRIGPGDRIHLSGVSGGGKSTLVSMLTGLRVPDSGLLLLDGLDRATLGSQSWRRLVVAAPQFHENHLFNESLAFNLLMGRGWPPRPDDLEWAEVVCRRLGLGDLLDRMPSGLFQIVGETGWQLSHGERSRVFMGRALLHDADLVILDESFAELDPESLRTCLPEAAELSNSLVVVAHA